MLGEQAGDLFRCWNSLSQEEFDALAKAGRPLSGCDCTGCRYLIARGLKPVTRESLVQQ